MKPQNFLLCFGGTNIIHFSLIVSIATSRYEFTDVPQNLVGQSIDSLSFGQFDLLKVQNLCSDQSELYVGHGSSHLFGSLLEVNACSGRPPPRVCICPSWPSLG